MSSPVHGEVRRRDAAASARALFESASELFGKHGFERTTLREIGELAGVDPALIARYFGSKADLYIAVVANEQLDEPTPSSFGEGESPLEDLGEMAELVLRRSDQRGPGPILQALIRCDTSTEIRDAARARLVKRLVEPLASMRASEASGESELRAEVIASALLGVSLGRSLGWFDALGSTPREDLVALVVEILGCSGSAED
jgi:AcrR family transcriptional regulator